MAKKHGEEINVFNNGNDINYLINKKGKIQTWKRQKMYQEIAYVFFYAQKYKILHKIKLFKMTKKKLAFLNIT